MRPRWKYIVEDFVFLFIGLFLYSILAIRKAWLRLKKLGTRIRKRPSRSRK